MIIDIWLYITSLKLDKDRTLALALTAKANCAKENVCVFDNEV